MTLYVRHITALKEVIEKYNDGEQPKQWVCLIVILLCLFVFRNG